jgi:beta-mannosidase
MARETELCGGWEILPVSKFDGNYDSVGQWHQISVPGHWQQVPDLESCSGKVVARRPFKFKPEHDRRMFLRFNGVFYWATAYLNGKRLGANEGYFFPVDYEVTGMLQKENELLVEVDCPDEKNKTYKRQLTGVFHHWDCLDPETNPGGIWLPVEILSTGPARVIDPLFTTAYLGGDNSYARITGRLTIDTPEKASLKARVSFIPRTFEGEPQVFEREVKKRAGANTYHYSLDLKDPVLWWTHDHGRPDLYTLRVEVFVEGKDEPSDVWETPFGVRTFEMRDYIAFLNGRRFYLRGNNYPPGDTRISTVTKERADEDVRLARECNLNILRVHAHVDHPAFYDACDEQGMLLWQDFPMQWYYRPEVEAQAMRQVERMVFHLGNHPCVGVWCMHNEPMAAPDLRQGYKFGMIAKALFTFFIYSRNRDRMDRELARRVRFLDPSRFTTYCSGERGLFREAGDVHYYYGWYFGPMHWFHKKYKKQPDRLRFITEFGSQSLPNIESSKEFMADKIEDIDWRHLEKRHHLQLGFMKMVVNPKKFKTLEEFIQATQDYQSRLNQYHIDRIRALKYKPGGGCVPFILLDSNPAIQWSVIDYWREPKSSYYAMKKAMSPVYAFTIIDKPRYRRNQIAKLPVFAVNDTWEEVEVEVGLKVVSPVGDELLVKSYSGTLPADSEALALGVPEIKLRWAGIYKVAITLKGPGADLENNYNIKVK